MMRSVRDLIEIQKGNKELKMDLKPIEKVLQPPLPEIEPTPLGRHRLIQALRNQYGPSYRNHKEVMKAIEHFDQEKKYFDLMRRMKAPVK